MTITLRRTPNGRILELGCGANPVVKPACQGGTDCTVDVRTCYDSTGKQTVDFVADFEKELPIQSDEFDSVFCQFALEHISYPNTLKFLKECYRVLKPGGYAVFVTPNTEAQIQWIISNPNGWDNKDLFHAASEILFGTLDYPENSHKAFLSPSIATKLFSEAGFTNVTTDAYNERKTDMVITAGKGTSIPASVSDPTVVRQGEAQMVDQAKSAVMKRMVEDVEGSARNKDDDRIHGYTREECFDKHYFNGGGKVGGYAREGYWDYPIHWATAHQVMIRRPQSVLELGAARGYVGKKLQDAGIRYAGLEISRHCYMTRACNPIHLLDLCTSKWPVEDQEFDYSFSCAVLEHIPRKYLSHVLGEMKRTCKNHFHGIDFGEKDDGFDKTHATLLKKTDWATLFSNAGLTNYEIVNKEDLEIGKIPEEVLHGDGKVKLNLGSHTTMALHGWINLDIGDLGGFANHYGYKYQRHDLKAGLPYGTGAVDMIALQHVLEHFTYSEGLSLLRECRRVVKPGSGVIRLAVPDMSLLTRGYIQNTLAEFDEINDECANSPTSAGKFWTLLHHGHQAAYDAATLTQIMKEANLVPTITDFRKTEVEGVKQILRETLDMHPCISLYADGIPFVG